MINTYPLKSWKLIYTAENSNTQSEKISLPFTLKADGKPDAVFSSEWQAEKPDEGKTVYLCVPPLGFDAEIYINGIKNCVRRAGPAFFYAPISEAASAGKAFSVGIKPIVKNGSQDSFVFSGAAAVTVNPSHFDLKTEENIKITSSLRDGKDRKSVV